jgi:two-component system OmpR family response regulator
MLVHPEHALSASGRPSVREREILVFESLGACNPALLQNLAQAGFSVEVASDFGAVFLQLSARQVDLVILDLPRDVSAGFTLCRRFARIGQPVMLLFEVADETDRIIGLELGADDCVSKDLSVREILAHVRAVVRSRAARRPDAVSPRRHWFGGFCYDPSIRVLRSPSGETARLSPAECAVLGVMLAEPSQIFSREQLRQACRLACVSPRAVDVRMSRLRKRLEYVGFDFIRTVRRQGYKLAPPAASYS